MNEFLNKWFLLDLLFYKDEFQEINKLDLVHPLDTEVFKSNPMNKLYECIGIEGDFLVIKHKANSFRIKKEAIKQLMPNPKFKWGEKVIQISKPEIESHIDDFFWHYKNGEYLYNLIVNGKRKSNRYNESDLEKVE
mgnify:CR=1 FL=1|jgi:hypothetical protein